MNTGFYAVNPDGTLKWGRTITVSSISSSPVIAPDGTIYIQDGFDLAAFSPDGTQLWRRQLADSSASSNASPSIGADGTIYIAEGIELQAINPNGTLKWRYQTAEWGEIVSTPAIAADGTIYIAYDGLYAVNLDGSLKWKFSNALFSQSSPIIGADGTIYWREGWTFYAVNPNGTQQWQISVPVPGSSMPSPVIGSDGTLYISQPDIFSSLNQYLRAYQASADTTPDPFTFIDVTGVPLSTVQTSNAITVSGITAPAAISIVGGAYELGSNPGVWTSSSGTVANTDTVRVRHTSAATSSTAVNTTLTVGGVSDTFTSTTLAEDATPDPFAFVDQTGVTLDTLLPSNVITVTGINSPATITIPACTSSTCEYIINGGAWTSAPGTVTNGQTVQVRQRSATTSYTITHLTLAIGGVSDTFTSTTLQPDDTTPDPFSFTDVASVPLSTVQTSNAITVAGIAGPAPISIVGGEYAINGGTWTSSDGTVNDGDTVSVRHTSSATNSTAVNTTLTIGGIADTFTSTTLATPLGPDLTGFWISASQSCRNGKCTLKGAVRVVNQGTAIAPASRLRVFLSDDTVLDQTSDLLLKTFTIKKLKSGRGTTSKLKVKLPLGVTAAGKYLFAVIDALGTVPETDETNNTPMTGPIL
jgi:hypothetical protein